MRIHCLVVGLVLLAAGCSRGTESKSITLATTTSTQDSGLLDALLPQFRAATGIEVKVVAVGSGQALELARRGDADVVLAHDPGGEEKFMAEGHGGRRALVMANDFVLVGPKADPADIKGEKDIVAAFRRLADRGATFISRGDASGTHQKERAIWKVAGIEPSGAWYLRAGAGMGQVLRIASEKSVYTLTDRGTFLAQSPNLDLLILREGDPILENPYHVIPVNPTKHPGIHAVEAERFADWLLAPETQKAIGAFGVDRFKQPLFYPRRRSVKRRAQNST